MPFNEAKLDKTYQTGDRGKKVKLIQECLCLSDFAVKVDGVFGAATEQSVRGFQTKKGVAVTGTVDQATMDHLATCEECRAIVAESRALLVGLWRPGHTQAPATAHPAA